MDRQVFGTLFTSLQLRHPKGIRLLGRRQANLTVLPVKLHVELPHEDLETLGPFHWDPMGIIMFLDGEKVAERTMHHGQHGFGAAYPTLQC